MLRGAGPRLVGIPQQNGEKAVESHKTDVCPPRGLAACKTLACKASGQKPLVLRARIGYRPFLHARGPPRTAACVWDQLPAPLVVFNGKVIGSLRCASQVSVSGDQKQGKPQTLGVAPSKDAIFATPRPRSSGRTRKPSGARVSTVPRIRNPRRQC